MITVIFAVYCDFWPLPWFHVTAVNIGVLYAISVYKRSLLSKFCSTFPFRLCTSYAHSHVINFAYLLSLRFWDVFFIISLNFEFWCYDSGGMSCSHYFSCFTFMVETIVSKTTKCRDFAVIFPIFSKMHRDFSDFLPWFSYSPSDDRRNCRLVECPNLWISLWLFTKRLLNVAKTLVKILTKLKRFYNVRKLYHGFKWKEERTKAQASIENFL